MKTLAVSETFYSIQGEGQTMGIPAVFLRLGGCNLLCESPAWRCDTIEVWRKSRATKFAEVLALEYIQRLKEGAHLVITGGEPLMQQLAIFHYLNWIKDVHGFTPVIEIETNGTKMVASLLQNKVDFWNVSPKLSTAGEQNKRQDRINELALRWFSSQDKKAIFKFVISSEEDVIEILQDFAPYMEMKQAILMPAGSSQEELSRTRVMVAEQCRKLGLRYSERLHVVIWNLKTGV